MDPVLNGPEQDQVC